MVWLVLQNSFLLFLFLCLGDASQTDMKSFCRASQGILDVVDVFLAPSELSSTSLVELKAVLATLVTQDRSNANSSDLLSQAAYASSLLHHIRLAESELMQQSAPVEHIALEMKVVWMAIQGTDPSLRSAFNEFMSETAGAVLSSVNS